MKLLPSVPVRNNNWKTGFADYTQLIEFFQKRKMDQKFPSVDFDSWRELSGSLMANRNLVQNIQVPLATADRGVAVALIQEYV